MLSHPDQDDSMTPPLRDALVLLAISALLAGGVASRAAAQTVPPAGAPPGTDVRTVLRAEPAEGPMAVDGRLDEAAWDRADVVRDLLQVEPDEGARGTQ